MALRQQTDLCVICPSHRMGGAEKYAATIAMAAHRLGQNVLYLCQHSRENHDLRLQLTQGGIKVQHLTIANSCTPRGWHHFLGRLARCLINLLKNHPKRILLALPWPTDGLDILSAIVALRIPSAVVFQLVPPDLPINSRHRSLLRTFLLKPNIRLVSISQNNRAILTQQLSIDGKEIAVIYNGSSSSRSLSVSSEKQKIAWQDFVKRPTSPVVLTAGRICPQKGYDLIIPVIPHIAKEFPNVLFVWAGRPDDLEYRKLLLLSIKQYGVENYVYMPGHLDNIPQALDSSDFFLFPTRFEGGQSFALTEAMEAGIPIVASNASGIGEVMRHQIEGVVFRTNDSVDLLEALRWALRNREAMSQMGKAAMIRQAAFSEEAMIQQTLEVLK